MAVRYKPPYISENTYFITFTILGWKYIFTELKYFNLIYKWFDYCLENYQNKIHGYVIMPNHIHVLMYLSDESPDIAKLVQNAKRFLAYQIVELLYQDEEQEILDTMKSRARVDKKARHKVFEDKYDSKLIDRDLFNEKLNYIHNNPCQEKWRLVKRPEYYIHSSAANYLLGKGYYNNVEIITT